MSSSATCPEELELLLEDACLLSDISLLSTLFDNDAVLLTRASSQVRGRSAIAEGLSTTYAVPAATSPHRRW
jgi:hypothetical protein